MTPQIKIHNKNHSVGIWLLLCCFMIFIMIMIGGITRLTESGLSITEWKPIMGMIPPLNQLDWEKLFNLYQQTPEYIKINQGMTLDEFKSIFWWEYIHRFWGRLIGLVFFIPFILFAIQRRFSPSQFITLFFIFLLGGLQGFIGWYMVKSGLSIRTDVSQYRLTLHLLCALLLFGLIFRQALSFLSLSPTQPTYPINQPHQPTKLLTYSYVLIFLIALTILMGGFTAGLNGGLVYNSFPYMGPKFVPEEFWYYHPMWRAPFESPASAQFFHRWIALFFFINVMIFKIISLKYDLSISSLKLINSLVFLTLFQVMLGILTVLYVVPISVALIHQANALLTFTILLWLNFDLKRLSLLNIRNTNC
ncbi:MAG: COX15/CtaA family protein [Alphaproteobacteria bacterium]|nr:COX15/CtaA family protein [Alphaproteobacteria bacterium]